MSLGHQQPYLEITDRHGKVQRYMLKASPVTIGRGTEAALRLPSNDVSREHAELASDDLGRWSIRDLHSRNGTSVNGERIESGEEEKHWVLLEPGDVVTIPPFTMTLLLSTPAIEEAMGQELSYFNVNMGDDDDVAPRMTTLEDARAATIAPTLLQELGALGMRLVLTRNAIKRLGLLFEYLLSEPMHGQVAMAIRLSKARLTDQPRMLVAPRTAPSWPEGRKPHISRSALRAILARGEAVLAGGSGGAADGGIEMSVQPDVPSAAILAPLRSDAETLDLIYLVVPPEFGTTDWLALVSLAARQYEISELARQGGAKPR